jgi:hypothetical protein
VKKRVVGMTLAENILIRVQVQSASVASTAFRGVVGIDNANPSRGPWLFRKSLFVTVLSSSLTVLQLSKPPKILLQLTA